MVNKQFNFHDRQPLKDRDYWAIAGKKGDGSWCLESKQTPSCTVRLHRACSLSEFCSRFPTSSKGERWKPIGKAPRELRTKRPGEGGAGQAATGPGPREALGRGWASRGSPGVSKKPRSRGSEVPGCALQNHRGNGPLETNPKLQRGPRGRSSLLEPLTAIPRRAVLPVFL